MRFKRGMFMQEHSKTKSGGWSSRVLRDALTELHKDQRGASFVEYVIVVGLVAIISIVAFQNFGKAIVTKLGEETSAVSGLQISSGGAATP
jgi:Flp pilus assembly pilin Flp